MGSIGKILPGWVGNFLPTYAPPRLAPWAPKQLRAGSVPAPVLNPTKFLQFPYGRPGGAHAHPRRLGQCSLGRPR